MEELPPGKAPTHVSPQSLSDYFEEAVSDLTSRFRCLDEPGACFFLQVAGEQP
jgi:hypothetical protein